MSTIFILLPLNIKSFQFLNITDIIVIMYVHPGFLPWDKFLEELGQVDAYEKHALRKGCTNLLQEGASDQRRKWEQEILPSSFYFFPP